MKFTGDHAYPTNTNIFLYTDHSPDAPNSDTTVTLRATINLVTACPGFGFGRCLSTDFVTNT